MSVEIVSKTCLTCQKIKPFSEFSTKQRGKYGYDSRCRECYCRIARARKTDRIIFTVLDNEEWRDIPGYEGVYRVSDFGRVCRVTKYGEKSLLNPSLCNGYFRVNLSLNNKTGKQFVHRLVAAVFLQADTLRKYVNHKDTIRTNNRLENLEYVTPAENSAHAKSFGLFPTGDKHHFNAKPNCRLKGENVGTAKLSNAQVIHIKEALASKLYTGKELAKIYGVSPSVICSINKNRRWQSV
jgi:hypothetical protein